MKRIGKRGEIETWMKKNNIDMLAKQETHLGQNSRERRGTHTWYFSGEKHHSALNQEYTIGTGCVINNKFIKYIDDIIPISDKLIAIRINGTCKSTMINNYTPQAYRDTEEKQEAYDDLGGTFQNTKVRDQCI